MDANLHFDNLIKENREAVLKLINTRPKDVASTRKVMPNFLVIGAPKAGTTSIHEYLKQHPDIYVSPLKNPAFFIWEGKSKNFFGRNVVNSLEAYHALFQYHKDEIAIGEVSPGYLPDYMASYRIKQHIPNVKLIAILRQPAERAYSQYWFNRQIGVERFDDFLSALKLEELVMKGIYFDSPPKYIGGGFYYRQLMRYYEFFEKEQLKVIIYDDFLEKPRQTLREIFAFLQVDEEFVPDISQKYNVTVGPNMDGKTVKNLPSMPAHIREILMNHYEEDILRLQSLLGCDLSKWLNFIG